MNDKPAAGEFQGFTKEQIQWLEKRWCSIQRHPTCWYRASRRYGSFSKSFATFNETKCKFNKNETTQKGLSTILRWICYIAFREAFMVFDRNGNGSITSTELGVVMRNLGQNPSQEELYEMVLEIDADGNDNIEFDEFLAMMERKMRALIPDDTLHEAFQIFDKDGNGFISLHELRHVMNCLGAIMSLSEVKTMMEEADMDKDGQLNFKEFAAMMN